MERVIPLFRPGCGGQGPPVGRETRPEVAFHLCSPRAGQSVRLTAVMTADDSIERIVVPACAGCGRCCHLTVELGAGDDVPEPLVVSYEGVRLMDQRGNG